MKKYILLLLIFVPFLGISQLSPGAKGVKSITLTGQVLDSSSLQKLEFVSVVLLNVEDSSIVTGGLTDSSGNFSIGPLAPQAYLLRLSFIGYNTKWLNLGFVSDDEREKNIGKIALNLSSAVQELGEVKAVGQLDVLKIGIDKRTYNVGEDINNQGGSATDVLNNVPSIEVDQDGNISLRGDGNVLVLIDGRPSTMAGSTESILRSIPSSSIERIEVVTNPSAKYDPDGTSGIINIVLKKNKLRGINGEVSATAATGNLYQGSAGLSIRNNKLNIYGNYSYNYTEGFRDFNGITTIADSNGNVTTLTQSRPGTDLRKNNTTRFGFDYSLSENKTIGISTTLNTSEHFRFGNLTNVLTNENDDILRQWNRRMTDPSKDKNNDYNLFYQWKFKEDLGEFSANFRFSDGQENRSGTYVERSEISNGEPDDSDFLQQRLSNDENNQVTTGQVDYSKVFSKRAIRIEAGAKQIIRNQNNLSYSERLQNSTNEWNPDTLANFSYEYHESITSTYFILGQALGKLKYQVGVRPEYAVQNPVLESKNISINNTYFNFFPSAHIRYNQSKEKEWGLSYSRRINRASSHQLNPFSDYSDPNNLRTGNPYLQPEYINSLDLSYVLDKNKWTFSGSAFYRLTTGVIQRFKVFFPNNTSAVTYQNIDQSNSFGTEFIINYKPTKNFRNNISINTDRIVYLDRTGESTFTNSGYNFAVKYSGSIDFWKKTASFQMNIRYNSPRITAQGTVLPRSAVDLSAQKKLKDGNWVIGARVSDVFNTQGFQYDLSQNGNRQTGNYKWQTRRAYLTVTYRFGKYEVSKKSGNSEGGGGGFDF
ncbi:MAG: TonB-dependent receptor [Bacteroidetes bacterium]|nr:TonB-dependent receptor [Bacteroidota bacterium]